MSSHKVENGVRYKVDSYMPARHPSAPQAHDFRTIPEMQAVIDSMAQMRKWVSVCKGARQKAQAQVDMKAVEVDSRIDVAIRCTVGGAGSGQPDPDQIVAAIAQAADVAQRDPKLEAMLKGLDRSIATWEREIAVDEEILRKSLAPDHLAALGIAFPDAPAPPAPDQAPLADPKPAKKDAAEAWARERTANRTRSAIEESASA